MESTITQAISNLNHEGFLNLPTGDIDLKKEINILKKEKQAIILAHYYQDKAIQELADYVGDSLGLSQKAKIIDRPIIVFAGVHFMAETAKIINPTKKVLLPDLLAGCSLSESCKAEDLKIFRKQHPDHIVITYINTSAEVKAYSDIVCTSSNALKIVNSIPEDQPIIFAPDKNLGKYIISVTGRDMLLWDGACIVHEAFSIDKILNLSLENPHAKIIAHPESEPHILKIAHHIGSTSQLISFAKNSPYNEFIVATEAGILHEMKKQIPDKIFIPAPSNENNTCACSECHFMKMNTLKKLYLCLKYELPEVHVSQEIREKALIPINRMFELS